MQSLFEVRFEASLVVYFWLVGTFDMVQGGKAGDPLHPTLRAPRQLVAFERSFGTFTPREVAWDGNVPRRQWESTAPQPQHRQPGSLEAKWYHLARTSSQPSSNTSEACAIAAVAGKASSSSSASQ